MQFNKIQRAKIDLFFNFAPIFVFIVLIPLFVRSGFWILEEVLFEMVLLVIGLLSLFFAFRRYDTKIKENLEDSSKLNLKLEKKEKELLGALEYLGKVNVQVSMIKSLFEKMKIPSTKNQLNEMNLEILRIACNISKEKIDYLRIIDMKNNRTMRECSIRDGEEQKNSKSIIGNKALTSLKFNENEIKFANSEKLNVFYSRADNFYIKAFILIPDSQEEVLTSSEKELLEALAGQCEITYLLFNSRYYRSKKDAI